MRLFQQRVYLRPVQFLLFFTFSLVAVSCTTLKVPTGPPKSWEQGEFIKIITERQEQFRSVRALARINYSGPQGSGGFQEAILVQRPNHLRLETLTYLGTVLIVTVNEKEITGYYLRDRVFVRGGHSKENLARYTQMPLELDEITKLLMGLPPVNTPGQSEQKANTLVFINSGERDVVTFGSELPVPTQWQRVNAAGQVAMSADFSDYIETSAGLFPSKILFQALTPKKRLEIRYEEPELNAELSPDLFSQQRPANVKELPIEALGG